MSAKHRHAGFGLFEFLVLSLATAVIIGVVIGLLTRADQQCGDSRVSLGSPTDQGLPSSDLTELTAPLPEVDRGLDAGNPHCSPHSVGGSLCLPATEDMA